MTQSKLLKRKRLTQLLGLLIGAAALYLSLKNVDLQKLQELLASIETHWITPIIVTNFIVIGFKSLRWQMTLRPVKEVGFSLVFKTLTIGFAANNVLPARLGEILRIHLLGKGAGLSRATIATTLLSDRTIEAVGFLLFASLLILATEIPPWIGKGLVIVSIITVIFSFFLILSSKKTFAHAILERLKHGLKVFHHPKILGLCLLISVLSWLAQAFMLWMVQVSFGIDLPLWGVIFVLVAINLAITLPGAPGHIGTFEYASILAYAAFGIDKNTALFLGASYHLLQIIPVTIAGVFFVVIDRFFGRNGRSEAPDSTYSRS